MGRSDTAFLLGSVVRIPGCVAARTWFNDLDVEDGCCERRRRPGPSRSGAEELEDGKYSEGTWSPGRRINGDDMVSSGKMRSNNRWDIQKRPWKRGKRKEGLIVLINT